MVRVSGSRRSERSDFPMLWNIPTNHMDHVERRTRPQTALGRPNRALSKCCFYFSQIFKYPRIIIYSDSGKRLSGTRVGDP